MAQFNIINKADLNIKTDYIEVLKYAILQNSQNGYYLQLKLKNISDDIIKGFDLVYSINNVVSIYHFNGNIEPNEEFFSKNLINVNGTDFKFMLFQSIKTATSNEKILKRLNELKEEENKLKSQLNIVDNENKKQVIEEKPIIKEEIKPSKEEIGLKELDNEFNTNKDKLLQSIEKKKVQLHEEEQKRDQLIKNYKEAETLNNDNELLSDKLNDDIANVQKHNLELEEKYKELEKEKELKIKSKTKFKEVVKYKDVYSNSIPFIYYLIVFVSLALIIVKFFKLQSLENNNPSLFINFLVDIIIVLLFVFLSLIKSKMIKDRNGTDYHIATIFLSISIFCLVFIQYYSDFGIIVHSTEFSLIGTIIYGILYLTHFVMLVLALVNRNKYKVNYFLIVDLIIVLLILGSFVTLIFM